MSTFDIKNPLKSKSTFQLPCFSHVPGRDCTLFYSKRAIYFVQFPEFSIYFFQYGTVIWNSSAMNSEKKSAVFYSGYFRTRSWLGKLRYIAL